MPSSAAGPTDAGPRQFAVFLSSQYPGSRYETEPLSGGLVNITARARLCEPSSSSNNASSEDGQQQPPPASLVLKYAPPFIAAVGSSAPFSQGRQAIEARTLRLFSPDGPLAALNVKGGEGVTVPRLVAHDTARWVLAMEDLGALVTLWDVFFFSRTNSSGSSVFAEGAEFCAEMGRRLGAFMAAVHSPVSLNAVLSSGTAAEAAAAEAADDAAAIVYSAAVEPVLARLQEQGGLSPTTASRLFERVHNDAVRTRPYAGEACLAMGDFHPGSVLVSRPLTTDPAADSAAAVPVVVAAIDWEFAVAGDGGRGVNGDMAQFLASLFALVVSLRPRWAGDGGGVRQLREAVGEFVRQLCRTYAARSAVVARVAAAVVERRAGDGQGVRLAVAEDGAMAIFRSALILFGRETVNQAVDLKWDISNGPSESLVAEMVAAGAWYLERAGDSVEEMLQDENWDKLMHEDMGFMLQLFGIET
ncbi:kinase-like domain-containing protein [Lasiosphaeria ovina]|uniref:Kinase-like domain-containing protein n=1 Tax=Lasiosphaeria ovina TaxID=92902 RepID=A0AAE0NL03_9PEZI|nr:kinase-like domain-containing protein [Lasiosphaeria ovina]